MKASDPFQAGQQYGKVGGLAAQAYTQVTNKPKIEALIQAYESTPMPNDQFGGATGANRTLALASLLRPLDQQLSDKYKAEAMKVIEGDTQFERQKELFGLKGSSASKGLTAWQAYKIGQSDTDKKIMDEIATMVSNYVEGIDGEIDVNSPEYRRIMLDVNQKASQMSRPLSKNVLDDMIKQQLASARIEERQRAQTFREKKFDIEFNDKNEQEAYNDVMKQVDKGDDKIADAAAQLSKVYADLETGINTNNPQMVQGAVKMLIQSLDNSAVMGNEMQIFNDPSFIGQAKSTWQRWTQGEYFPKDVVEKLWQFAKVTGSAINTFLTSWTTKGQDLYKERLGDPNATGGSIAKALDMMRVNVPTSTPNFTNVGKASDAPASGSVIFGGGRAAGDDTEFE